MKNRNFIKILFLVINVPFASFALEDGPAAYLSCLNSIRLPINLQDPIVINKEKNQAFYFTDKMIYKYDLKEDAIRRGSFGMPGLGNFADVRIWLPKGNNQSEPKATIHMVSNGNQSFTDIFHGDSPSDENKPRLQGSEMLTDQSKSLIKQYLLELAQKSLDQMKADDHPVEQTGFDMVGNDYRDIPDYQKRAKTSLEACHLDDPGFNKKMTEILQSAIDYRPKYSAKTSDYQGSVQPAPAVQAK